MSERPDLIILQEILILIYLIDHDSDLLQNDTSYLVLTHRSLELLEDNVVVDHNASAAEGLHLHPLEGLAQ